LTRESGLLYPFFFSPPAGARGALEEQMPAEKPRIDAGPKKHFHTKQYGKFRIDVYNLPRHRILLYEMQGFISAEHIDAYIDDLLAAAQATRPVGMIADPRKMEVLSPELQQAIRSRGWPALARLGVKRNPAIIPPTALTRSSVRRMVSDMGQTVELEGGYRMQIALFESLEDCIEWILLD
jgi:hypothetical protein